MSNYYQKFESNEYFYVTWWRLSAKEYGWVEWENNAGIQWGQSIPIYNTEGNIDWQMENPIVLWSGSYINMHDMEAGEQLVIMNAFNHYHGFKLQVFDTLDFYETEPLYEYNVPVNDDYAQDPTYEIPTWQGWTADNHYDNIYITIDAPEDECVYIENVIINTAKHEGSNNFSNRYAPLNLLNEKKNKLDHADWNESDTDSPNYIENKPTIPVLPNNIVTANQTLSVAVVSTMPATPDANTLYLVTGS